MPVAVVAETTRFDLHVRLEEVLEHGLARVGEDGLGVELDALGGQLAVSDGHHDAPAAGGHLERIGDAVVGHDERVIAPHGQR